VWDKIARLDDEAAWLSQQRSIEACVRETTGALSAHACMDDDVVRAAALCVYGHEAAVLFEQW
jgi:hypothetical protein